MDASTDTVSSDTATSYQTASTYFFVPKTLGDDATTTTDDTNTPGAYFRLGGYSDLEAGATDDTVQKQFYPQRHIDDAGSANVVRNAAGTTRAAGIMLACSGRLLIRSAENTYLHSTGKIDIQTGSDFIASIAGATTITSGGKMAISTTNGQDIKITADGNISTKGMKAITHYQDEDWTVKDSDSYSMYKCNVYNWKQGGTWDFVAAGKFSYYAGIGLSINSSVDLTISASAAILLYLAKLEFGVIKIDVVATKIEVKNGKVEVTNNKVGVVATKVKNSLVEVKNDMVISSLVAIMNATAGIASIAHEISSQIAAAKVTIAQHVNL